MSLLRDQLVELLEPEVVGLGYELWELEYAGRAGAGLLRLYIDSVDSATAITLDDCEKVSRRVSEALDAADPIPGEYTLEVSSPGLDRVLRKREHFVRFAGNHIQVEMKIAVNGRKRFAGELEGVEADELVLRMQEVTVKLPIDAIHKARVAP